MSRKKLQFETGNKKAKSSRATASEIHGRFVFGLKPVLEALRARAEEVEHIYLAHGHVTSQVAAELFSRARDLGVRVTKVPRERLNGLAEGGLHQGVVAEMQNFRYVDLGELIDVAKAESRRAVIVVLDGIQDPHNLGAIIRSAHALGAQGIIIPKDRAVGVTGAVAKASAGAIEHTRISQVTNVSRALEQLKENGFWVVAATPGNAKPLWELTFDGPTVLLVGAEGAGIREGVLKHVDYRCEIPMLGQIDSLNASVSAGILLYEALRQSIPKAESKK